MKGIWAISKRLLAGILVMLLFMTALPVYADYTEGELSEYVARIPVTITEVRGSYAKIEQLSGPASILPGSTELHVDTDGKGVFEMSFAGRNGGEVFKYRITEVPGGEKDVRYNIGNKTYICEVWIFENEDAGANYARAFLYESETPLDLRAKENENVPKPGNCEFVNQPSSPTPTPMPTPTPALKPPTPQDATSSGRKGETQASDGSADSLDSSGEVSFIKGDGDFEKIRLIDPHSGKPTDATEVDALDANGKKIGTYRLKAYDLEGGKAVVEFIPDPDFVGTPQPAKIQALDTNGFTATALYTPLVVAPPDPQDAETWGPKGEKQSSDKSVVKVLFKKGNGKFISMRLIDPRSGKPTDATEIDALDKDGKVIGKYKLINVDLETGEGTVEFYPNPDFVGDPQPCGVIVEDEYGYTATAWYQPHVKGDEETPVPTKAPGAHASTSPKTGDGQGILLYALAFLAAGVTVVGLRKRQTK